MPAPRKACVAACCAAAVVLAGAAQAGKPIRQYKRVHVAEMKRLLAGRFERAVQSIQAFLERRPKDVESQYCLAIAKANLKDIDGAMAAVKAAVEGGMDVGRFLAGPRKLTRPLVESEAFRAFLKSPQSAEPVHGPLLGCLSDTGASFWVRTAAEASVQVAVTPAEGAKDAVPSPVVRTRKDRDYTAVASVTGLKADTLYDYDVLIDGKSTRRKREWRFRTYRPPGAKWKFDVAFGGGAGFVPPNERVWDTIRTHRPRAFLAMGDNIYIDTPTSGDIQRYCYYRRQSRPEYRRLIATTCVYAIWDDHDFGTNDCWGGPAINDPPWKLPVWRVFRNNWNNPAYGGGPKQPGCWYDFSIGAVDFFMTDGRYYRTPPKKTPEAERSMLGPVQKRWLLDRLRASKATFRVLVSGTPWTFDAKGKSPDTWNGFRRERNDIFAFLAEHKIGGVVLLSADRHRHDVWKIPRDGAYDLYEFESSRLTNQHKHVTMKQAMFSWNGHGFGLLTFDTTAADPTVTYRIISIDDKLMNTFTVKRSQLADK